MSDALGLLTLQFLAWVAERPRSYAETMEAWRTSCPRLPVWEDATSAGWVQLQRGKRVALTAQGRAVLESGGVGPSAGADTALQISARTV
jgi:hypothetical protein